MSLKYCFKTEIHKTFSLPSDYTSLIEEIKSLFVQKLPSRFFIKYQDADGDHIVISTNQEYSMMIAHELPKLSSSIKLFITPIDSLPETDKKGVSTPRSSASNGSFEVVEDDNSLKVEEVIDDLSLNDTSKDNSTSKVVVSLTIPCDPSAKDTDNILPKLVDSDREDSSFSNTEGEEEVKQKNHEQSLEWDEYEEQLRKLKDAEANSLRILSQIPIGTELYTFQLKQYKEIDALRKLILSNSEVELQQQEDLSRALAPESSLSNDGEESIEEKEDEPLPSAFFTQALHTDEDNFSFSNESFKKGPDSEDEYQDRKIATLRVPTYRENDSKDLSEYLNNVAPKRSLDRSFETPPFRYQSNTHNIEDGKKQKEDSQEKWVSFSTEQDDAFVGQYTQNIELQGRGPFNSKHKTENLFVCQQEPSFYKYQRGDDLEEDAREEDNSELKLVKDAFKVRDFEDFVMDVKAMGDMLVELKENSFYQEKNAGSFGRGCGYSFEEERQEENSRNVMSKDVWYDAYQTNWDKPVSPASQLESNLQVSKASESQMNFSNELSCNLDDYLRKSTREDDGRLQENVENMNISLLSMSEAKYMASAIGSINKIRGFKQKLTRDAPVERETVVNQVVKKRVISPSYNEWMSRNYEIKARDEKPNPYTHINVDLKENNKWLANKREEPQTSFCAEPIENSSECQRQNYYFGSSELHSPQYDEKVDLDDSEVTSIELLSNLCSDFSPRENQLGREDNNQDEKVLPNNSNSYDSNASARKTMSIETFHDMDEAPAEYKFEYKELKNTPLSIRPGTQEWCVVFKTISLKNTGNVTWTRCLLSPVGLDSGSKSEVTYLAPGDSVYVTLEIFGFFKPGKYTSTWRVTHRGEMESNIDLGYVNLEFEIFEKKSFLYENDIYRTTGVEGFEEDSIEFNLY